MKMLRLSRIFLMCAVISMALVIGPQAIAQSNKSEYARGEEYYNNKEFKQAAESFRRVYRSDAKERHKAAHRLGELHEKGLGVPQSFRDAIKYYHEAAARRIQPAYVSLGRMYEGVQGVPTDKNLSKSWYHRAAREGNVSAQLRLGEIYADEFSSCSKDQENIERCKERKSTTAHKWFNLAGTALPKARQERDLIAKKMESSHVVRAQQMALEWKPLMWRPSGSGFLVTRDGHILTAEHVVRQCQEVTIQSVEVPEITPAEIVRMEESPVDLALLKVSTYGGKPARFPPRNKGGVRLGADVMAVGYPAPGTLVPVLDAEPVVTRGNVSAVAGVFSGQKDSQRFQFTAPIQGGNSGGPVLDSYADVIGVTVSGVDWLGTEFFHIPFGGRYDLVARGIPAQNVNYAVSLDTIRNFLNSTLREAMIDINTERKEISPVDVAEMAREFTVLVDCWCDTSEKQLPCPS